MKHKIFLFFLFLLTIRGAYAQEDLRNEIPYKKIDPIEPTAASLGKYGEYNVGYFNGLPDISIPLYEISSGKLKQPLKLSYHGGGIKASQDATWVGLGWDIFFGGMITRQVNGLPDEIENFMTVPDANEIHQQIVNNPQDFNNTYYNGLADGKTSQYSFMQDVYHVSLDNFSGKFVLDNTNSPLVIPHDPIKIEGCDKIVGNDGTIYEFTPCDETTIITPQHDGPPPHTTTWYIKRIISADLRDTILYEYQDDGYIDLRTFSYSEGYKTVYNGCDYSNLVSYETIPLQQSSSFAKTYSKKPQFIYFKGGRIEFILSDRSDIYTSVTGRALHKLDNIRIQKKATDGYETIRTIRFNYSYFGVGNTNYEYLRLKLLNITEYEGETVDETLKTTSFGYYGNSMCSKTTYSTDSWGYYNAKGNTTPIPLGVINLGNLQKQIGGADKTPNEDATKIGSLQEIIYPTGGKTVFDWELNRYAAEEPVTSSVIPATISMSSSNNPELQCTNKTPSPDENYSYVSQTFTSYLDQTVTVHSSLIQQDQNNLTHNKYDLATISISGGVFENTYIHGGTLDQLIYLRKGQTYTVSIYSNCSNILGHISFTYNSYNPNQDKYNYPIGGLRIKSIKNYDSDSHLSGVRNFSYLNPSNNRSSGFLTSNRTITYLTSSHVISSFLDTKTWTCTNSKTSTFLYHESPVTGIYSNTVCYQYVTEYSSDDTKANGYTEYEYRVASDELVDEHLPLISNEWNRGQLLRKTDFKYVGQTPERVSETFNEYLLDPGNYGTSKGFKMTKYLNISGTCSNCNPYILDNAFTPRNYYYISEWLKLNKTQSTVFSGNNFVTNTINYAYTNPIHCQPTQKIYSLGDNRQKIIKTKFPDDYASNILPALKTKHMTIFPVEQQIKIGQAGYEKITEGFINNY